MLNMRDIRRRKRAVANTKHITRAMQLVAASKMKHAQQAAISGRPFALLLLEVLGSIQTREVVVDHPFFTPRECVQRGVLVVSSDRGLCGPLNAQLFRKIEGLGPNVSFVAIGRKAIRYLERRNRTLLGSYSVSDSVKFSEIRDAVQLLLDSFYEKKIDTIEVLYPHFINTLKQEPCLVPLVPLDNVESLLKSLYERTNYAVRPTPSELRQMHFEPDLEIILERIAEFYIKQKVRHFVVEGKASEYSARMVAMKQATENATDLIARLSLQYNKLRQAAITQEIIEIAAANAL